MNVAEKKEESVDVAEYYHVLLRHKWTIIASLLIMVSLIVFFNAIATPIYEATATLILDKESGKSPISGERVEYQSSQSESLTFFSHFELITSRPVLEQVVRDLKLDQIDWQQKEKSGKFSSFKQLLSNWKTNIRLMLDQFLGTSDQPPPFEDFEDKVLKSVKKLQDKDVIDIKHIEATRLVNINVFAASPEMSRDIANAVAQAYIDFNINNRLKASRGTIGFLTNHLHEIQKNLEDAEREFLEFKQNIKLISMEESQRVITQKITEFTDSYLQSRNRRLELDSKLKKINEISKSGKDLRHLSSLIANDLINTLYSQLIQTEVELSRLGKVYKEKHPKIVQIKTKADNTRNKLNQEIRKELDNLKVERSVLLAKEKVLQETMKDFKDEALEINKKEFQYNILKRNVQMNQNLYDTLLSRLKEADLTGNIDTSNIRITEKAVLPKHPVRPKKTLNLILGVIFGLLIGIGFSFMLEYIDRSITTESDVKKYIDLPVLAMIPISDVPEK
ncbi:MAG TPA: aldo/keto reductase [Desulfobacterales bacterium]|nr:aldo/keto reductase [Desulfobacterales bacterium]